MVCTCRWICICVHAYLHAQVWKEESAQLCKSNNSRIIRLSSLCSIKRFFGGMRLLMRLLGFFHRWKQIKQYFFKLEAYDLCRKSERCCILMTEFFTWLFDRLLAISILFGIHHGSFNCDNGYLLRYYYTGSIILLSFGIVLTAAMMWLSMKGSIRNDYARRHLNIILYLKLLLLLPEAIWITVATYWTFGFSYSCELTVYWTARGAVICAWIVGFWMFIGILIVFDPMGSVEQHMDLSETSSRKSSKYLIANSKSVNARVWEQR